jgi:hypothetical protein
LNDAGPQVPPPDEPPAADVEMLEAADPLIAEKPSDVAAPPLSFAPAALPPDVLASDLAAAAASAATAATGPAGPADHKPHGPADADEMRGPSTSSGPGTDVLAAAIDKPRAALTAAHSTQVEPPADEAALPPAAEAPRRAPDIVVVARETHLPPAALPSQMRARTSDQGGVAPEPLDSSTTESDAKSGKVALAQTVAGTARAVGVAPATQPKRGNDDSGLDAGRLGQRSTSTISARSSPSDAAQPAEVQAPLVHTQAQTRTNARAAEASFDPAQPAQTVRSPAQDEHLAPQATVPVPRQIVDGIAAEIPPPRDTSPAGPAAAPTPGTQSQPVKVVTIQLNPAELGTLTVRISLRNDALELQVETSRRDTARMVEADRDALSSLLRSAGYHVEAVTVRAVEQPTPAMAAGTAAGSPDGTAQSQSGGSQTDQRPSGGRAHADGHREGHGTRQGTRGDESGSRHRAGRGLYV